MKITCLSKGRGFHFPPCHILNFCGIRILLECPLDLSALMAFSPLPPTFEEPDTIIEVAPAKRQRIENHLGPKTFIFAEPWYKTVTNLHLWNPSFIDVVLISTPMGILGLPFLTRIKGFSAKIYVTEASTRLGKLMMEDLVSMHEEYRLFYGAAESSFPSWSRHEELETRPSEVREIILGKDGAELGGWMPLYSAADVKDCVRKINALKYAEEECYNGTLVIKAFSSGVEIGSCNWTLNGPEGDIAYLSSSSFISSRAMAFDYHSLQGTGALLYSDFSSSNDTQDVEDGETHTVQSADKLLPMSFHDSEENIEEKEKIVFISSCAIDCVKGGGSVLIPINQLGTSLQLLEEMTTLLNASAMKVPVYIISSVAEELLSFLNIIPEWLCKQRQERLFVGEPLFAHVNLLKEKKIHVVPDVNSDKLLMHLQEPCIVFCPHWSLRLGPVVHLLHRWCRDPKSLLIIEDVLNPELALLPFKPVAMKVLQCLFPYGIGLQKVQPLLQALQPKTVLFPEELRLKINFSSEKSYSVLHYAEGETSKVSCQKDNAELKIATDLASQFFRITFKKEEMDISRLRGELFMENARYHLLLGNNDKSNSLGSRPLVRCGLPDSEKLIATLSKMGLPDSEKLIATLSKMGIEASTEQGTRDTESNTICVVHTQDPYKVMIEIGTTGTVITTADQNVAFLIYKALDNIFDRI